MTVNEITPDPFYFVTDLSMTVSVDFLIILVGILAIAVIFKKIWR